MKLGTATAKHDLTVRYLQDMTVVELGGHTNNSMPLGTLRLYLSTLSRNDALISRALTELMTWDKIVVGHDHIVRLLEPNDEETTAEELERSRKILNELGICTGCGGSMPCVECGRGV